MSIDQFEALAILARLKYGSKAFMSAKYCIVNKYTQQKAAALVECRQSTVSAAIRKIRAAQRLANHGADRH
jgi:hypothetical protein